MANKRISSLDDITLVGGTSTAEVNANDILPITDVDDTTGSLQGTTKAVKVSDLMGEAPVQSVAGRTGAVTIANTDVSGLGTASTQDVGTADGNVVQLSDVGGTVKLPAVDGSQLTAVSGTDSTKLAIANDLSDLNNAATARSNLGVDAAGTDNSTDVSLDTASHDYLSLTGQTISLGAIDLSTDVTGSLPNTSVSGLGTAATTASTDYATASQGALADTAIQPSGITNMVETTDSIDVLADVDTSTVAPTTNDLLKWNGSNFVPGTVSVDVDTPLNTALRGTDNPHIGAFPNQSFKVTDNPYKSVMVIADADGNLEFLTKDGANVFVNTPSSRLALAKGFSIQADGAEPDIEAVDTDGTTYSVISGDTDTKGANGLPTRQGFNYPDIGAYPAPLLSSGGSIA